MTCSLESRTSKHFCFKFSREGCEKTTMKEKETIDIRELKTFAEKVEE